MGHVPVQRRLREHRAEQHDDGQERRHADEPSLLQGTVEDEPGDRHEQGARESEAEPPPGQRDIGKGQAGQRGTGRDHETGEQAGAEETPRTQEREARDRAEQCSEAGQQDGAGRGRGHQKVAEERNERNVPERQDHDRQCEDKAAEGHQEDAEGRLHSFAQFVAEDPRHEVLPQRAGERRVPGEDAERGGIGQEHTGVPGVKRVRQHDRQHRHPEGVQRLGRADEQTAQEEDRQHDAGPDRAAGEPGECDKEKEEQDGAAGRGPPSRAEMEQDLVDQHGPEGDMEPGDREQVQDTGPLEDRVRVCRNVRLVPDEHAFEDPGLRWREPLLDAFRHGLPQRREPDAQRPPGEFDRRHGDVSPALGLIERVRVDPPSAGRPEIDAPGLVIPGDGGVLFPERFRLQGAAEHIADSGLIGVGRQTQFADRLSPVDDEDTAVGAGRAVIQHFGHEERVVDRLSGMGHGGTEDEHRLQEERCARDQHDGGGGQKESEFPFPLHRPAQPVEEKDADRHRCHHQTDRHARPGQRQDHERP